VQSALLLQSFTVSVAGQNGFVESTSVHVATHWVAALDAMHAIPEPTTLTVAQHSGVDALHPSGPSH
jgi:hypothetical protein